MRKLLLFISTIFFSGLALACAVPNAGPDVDELIRTEKLDKVDEFLVEVPTSLGKPNIYLVLYTKEAYEASTNGPVMQKLFAGETVSREEFDTAHEASRPEKSRKLRWLKRKNDYVSKTFKIKAIENHVHIIHVHWETPCCLCDSDGYSKPLEFIDKTQQVSIVRRNATGTTYASLRLPLTQA